MTYDQGWIRISHANKIIKGKYVLSDIHADFERGNVYGIIGDNGSGKTMFLRAVSKLLCLSSGRVIYQKENLTKGVILENPGFLPTYSGLDNLIFLARIRNVVTVHQIKSTMERVGLDPNDKRKVREYSLGMKQKLAIAQAIMEEPDLLILDEPFRGLDVKSLHNIRQLLIAYNKRGGTIFLTSHNPEDISMLCSCIYEMKDGTLTQWSNSSTSIAAFSSL